mmetsp:Transcript_3268/g.10000  ORF Transcript_3268/g.10000 Transcript_3268/m.10000 type:complete len:703 (+) Transcript_3268:61-2169(+)
MMVMRTTCFVVGPQVSAGRRPAQTGVEDASSASVCGRRMELAVAVARRKVRVLMFTDEQMAEYEARKKKKSSFLEIKEILKLLTNGYKKTAHVAYMKLRRTKRKVITRPQYITLVSQFGRHHSLQAARLVFNDMHRRHKPCNYAYNVLLRAYDDAGAAEKCRNLLDEMREKYLAPDATSYGLVVDAFNRIGQTETACEIYEEMLNAGVEPNYCALDAMMRVYLDLGDYEEVVNFDRQREGRGDARRTTQTYAMLIEAYSALDDERNVWATYEMMLKDFRAHKAYMTRVAQEELEMNRRGEEMELFSPHTAGNGTDDGSSPADLDYDDDELYDDEDYSDELDDETDGSEDLVAGFEVEADEAAYDSWYENVSLVEDGFIAMVRAEAKDPDTIARVLRDVIESPVEVSVEIFAACLDAFIACNAAEQARWLLDVLNSTTLSESTAVRNLKLRVYGALGDGDAVEEMHNQFRQDKTLCDKMTINFLVDAYRQLDRPEQAERALEEMRMMGFKASLGTYNILLEMYASRGDVSACEGVISRMQKRKLRANTRSYNLLLSAYVQNGDLDGAMEVKSRMDQLPMARSAQTYELLLTSAMKVEDHDLIEDLVAELERKGLEWSPEIFNILGEYYSKLKTTEGLAKLVEQLTSIQSPDESLIRPVLRALIDSGHAARAERLVETLQNEYEDLPAYAESLEPLKSLALQSC